MASIDSLKASDGTGAASVATVQSVRAPAATTLIVDTVQGINGKFHATMGTPHTFVDPVTSETITVISEATAVDFQGHVDGGNLEIDTIAPGFTDNGSAVSDIVIIKPTTQWADEVADVLEVSLEDNGTLKANTVDTAQLADGAVTSDKLTSTVAFSAYLNASYASSTSTTIVQMDTELYDLGSNFNTTTYQFTAPYDGIYHFDAGVTVSSVGDQDLVVSLYKNSTVSKIGTRIRSDAPSHPQTHVVSSDIQLAATNTVEVRLRTATASRTILHLPENTYFTGHLVGKT